VFVRIIAFRIVSSFRIQAMRARLARTIPDPTRATDPRALRAVPASGRRVAVHTRHVGGPNHLRQVAAASPLELDSELEIVACHGLCLMRQIPWTMTPATAEIRVTCIEALPRVPHVFGT
jgi:hypothetical protein